MAKDNNRGRTFWDLIAEHPKMTFSLIVLLLLTIVILSLNKYSIKSSVLSVEPQSTIQKSPIQNNLKDSAFSKVKIEPINSLIEKQARVSSKRNISLQTKPDTIRTEVVNVSSNNQSGGITANQVNIGAIPRKLNIDIENQLLGNLPNKGEEIKITSVMGDGEAFQYASEITSFLKANGFSKVDGVNQSVFNRPVIGQFFNRDSIGVKIIIGSKK